tara:strand:- start:143 stop:370 length:228 start_codon:yes stop_codon:yes gene_type:complete
MARKGAKGKPTRKDVSEALRFIGQKLQFLEELSRATENILDQYIRFNKDETKFLEFLKERFPEPEKEVESKEKAS